MFFLFSGLSKSASAQRQKNLKTYRIATVLIKMNVLSNLSDSEFSIGHGFVKVHDAS